MQHYADMPIHDLVQALGKQKEQIYRKARMLGLRRAASFSAATHFNTGKRHSPGTEFKPGQKPWNTGLKGWKAGGRSAETRFKKGERHGAAVHNYVPIGTLRISKDGYLEQKITDDPVPYPNKRWMAVHRMVWIKHHGPIPPKHIVAFKPGMRTADLALITIDRLQLMSMAENIRRNHWQETLPPEVASLVQLKGAIRRQVNRITQQADERKSKP